PCRIAILSFPTRRSSDLVYTPIGKYGTTVANYAVIAGVASDPGEIYISSTGTSGVYPGDGAPNDSVSINVATYAPETNGVIIGLDRKSTRLNSSHVKISY